MSDFAKKRVLIIAEGYEEKPYIEKIIHFSNISDVYHFSPVVNAKGAGNLFARYQYEMQKGFHDIVLIFCDVDKGSKEFFGIVNKIGNIFFVNPDDALKIFIFANPVTLQIVLSHFGDVNLTKVSKWKNSEIVKALTGIDNYDAKEKQIEEMMNKIHQDSLSDFKMRLNKLSKDINDIPSSNFLTFLERFENDDVGWIDDINNLLK